MAIEELFISSVFTSLGALAVFLYLYDRAKDAFFKSLWLTAICYVLMYSFMVQHFAFRSVGVMTDMGDLLEIFLQALIIAFEFLCGFMLLNLLVMAARFVIDGLKKSQGFG